MANRSWGALLWYAFLHFMLRLLGAMFVQLRVDGRQHVPHLGGGLLLCNHQSFYDPILVGLACDRQVSQLARKSLYKSRFYRWFIVPLGSIALDREGQGLAGLKETVARLKNGELVVMFPEGARCHDGEVQALMPGFGMIARRARVPLVPVAIDGAFQAWPRHRKLPGLATINISFGAPLTVEEIAALSDDQLLAEFERRLRALFDETRQRRLRRMTAT